MYFSVVILLFPTTILTPKHVFMYLLFLVFPLVMYLTDIKSAAAI